MYHRVGHYTGNLITLVERAAQCPIVWNPPGWGSCPCPDFPRVVPGDWRLAMMLGMKPGSHIPFHRDNPAAENGLSGAVLDRFHLVLSTNADCWNYHDGTWQQLLPGGIYQMDPTKEHASINLGDTVRFHLIVDVTA